MCIRAQSCNHRRQFSSYIVTPYIGLLFIRTDLPGSCPGITAPGDIKEFTAASFGWIGPMNGLKGPRNIEEGDGERLQDTVFSSLLTAQFLSSYYNRDIQIGRAP